MTRKQIDELRRLRGLVDKHWQSRQRAHLKAIAIERICDHRHPNGKTAVKRVSTHFIPECGGYKECSVCAGERPELYVDQCSICNRDVGGEYYIPPPFAKRLKV